MNEKILITRAFKIIMVFMHIKKLSVLKLYKNFSTELYQALLPYFRWFAQRTFGFYRKTCRRPDQGGQFQISRQNRKRQNNKISYLQQVLCIRQFIILMVMQNGCCVLATQQTFVFHYGDEITNSKKNQTIVKLGIEE